MYDIVFLTGLFPKELEKYVIKNSKGIIQNAANNLQWKFVAGLDKNNKEPVKIINSMYIGSYPFRFKKLLIPTTTFSHGRNSKDINVGFCNLFLFKHYFRYFTLRKYIRSWAKSSSKRKKILLAYAMTSPFLRIFKYAKKIDDSIITILIVPDIPKYMNTQCSSNLFYKLFKKIDAITINKNIKYNDYYVFITKYMAEYFNVSKNKYVVIEGIGDEIPSNKLISPSIKKNEQSILLYTGTLNKRYGIIKLLQAMEHIDDPQVRLYICGDGDAKEEVMNAANQDNRIIYLGQLPHSEVKKLQMNASILINPRNNNEEFTKYSFPSKILEYISSGHPTLVYKLDGIPSDYDDILFYIDDSTAKDMAMSIEKILKLSDAELTEIYNQSINFIQHKKSAEAQVRKIFEMLQYNENDNCFISSL